MAVVEHPLAGNPARITSILTALDTPAGPPTATVCVTTADNELIGTLDESVDLVGNVVTVVADWQIPDGQAEGVYVATIKTGGTMIAADEVRFIVEGRTHTDPH